MVERLKPIYIAGRAHSGSTFLDVILNSSSDLKGCGGILEGYNRGSEELCSCGKTISDCEKWAMVEKTYERRMGSKFRDDATKLYKLSDIRNFFSVLFFNVSDKQSRWYWYMKANNTLSASICEAFGVKGFIDSNKEYTRALMFLKSDPDARIIHIFRKVENTVASHYYRIGNDRPIKFLKQTYSPKRMKFPMLMIVAAGWAVGMIASVILKAYAPKRVLHFSYEAFSQNPRAELERLSIFLSKDLSDIIRMVETRQPFQIEHLLGGNEFKHKGNIKFIPNTSGRRYAPTLYRWGARFFAFPGILVKIFFVNSNDFKKS